MSTLYSYCGPFEEQLRITLCSDDEPAGPVQKLFDLAGDGRLVQAMYRPCPSHWERLCALEEDLLKADEAGCNVVEGWSIAVGECVALPGLTGWLEHEEGWALVACPEDYAKEHGTDFLIIDHQEFEAGFLPYIRACVPIGDDSGLRLNRALRENAALEDAFAGVGL